MCFSATASFTSSAVLAVIGVANLRNIKKKRQILLALIPLLFAVQQFSEGVIWLLADRGETRTQIGLIAQYTYLFFAFLIWPVWVPAAIFTLETIPWRKFCIGIILLIGSYVSFMHLLYCLQYTPDVRVVEKSIQYVGEVPSYKYLYGIAVTVPCFFSSFPLIWIFGILTGLALFFAQIFYTYAFVSVWCFLAALISGILYKVIKDHAGD